MATLVCGANDLTGNRSTWEPTTGRWVTNTAQFRTLSGVDYLAGCAFHLTGVITLFDTNRELLVLQDATGAVAIHYLLAGSALQVGDLATLDGTDCSPLLTSFPDYPYHPSGAEIRSAFEAPRDWGEYYLTRMRGWLRPRRTGQYSFWIASDNSSELWLSPDADSSKARRIAYITRFGWVNPREWSRYPSQHSDPVALKAGQLYYIEALQEQQGGADHLAVAWQGPGLDRAVIAGEYLTPPRPASDDMDPTTNGVLREYWTNFSSGDLSGIAGPRPFESALSVRTLRVHLLGKADLPDPIRIAFNQPLRREDNYRWMEAEGMVKFRGGVDGETALLDLSDRQSVIQVRALHWTPDLSEQVINSPVRVRGVCEGIYDQDGRLMPQLIWASASNSISRVVAAMTNSVVSQASQPPAVMPASNAALQGYYGTKAVVTFKGEVFGTNYIFAQEDANAIRVIPDNAALTRHARVGQWVDIGGALEPGKYPSVLRPIVVTDLGPHLMPAPITHPLKLPIPDDLEGRWSEVEGVVHSANANGTLSVVNTDGSGFFWIGRVAAGDLARYVDATICARGVLVASILHAPLLLIPSPDYIAVEEAAPKRPFSIPTTRIADLPEATGTPLPHRVRVAGVVTYCEGRSFFVQDASGGIRVRALGHPRLEIGRAVDVLGFQAQAGLSSVLTEALVRPSPSRQSVHPLNLTLSDGMTSRQNGSLVRITAALLRRTTNELGEVLELQQRQQMFVAMLAAGFGHLPDIRPGSRITATGVLDMAGIPAPPTGDKRTEVRFLTSPGILLRDAADVAVLSGPPWWTWKRAATLIGTLLTVLIVALLWIYFLRRRLERQQAAQLAFSQNVLERLENERRRIAANLHDSLGQMLMLIKSQAIWAVQGAPDEPGWRERLVEIGNATSQAIDEVRRITHGLRPYQLDRLGLTHAIRALVTRACENSSIPFASRVEDIDRVFDKDNEIHVYRIVQEAVNNIVKHSGATEATVVIKNRTTMVSLSIRDNGCGFDPEKPSDQRPNPGYGLKGIAERVRILGGTLAIDARPGDGVSTMVEIPLTKPSK